MTVIIVKIRRLRRTKGNTPCTEQLPNLCQPMKRYFIYLAIVAITSSIFLNTPVPTGKTANAAALSKPTIPSKKTVQPQAPSKTQPEADAVTSAASPAPVTSVPTFDPNNPATWPPCAANQIVRADTGQCEDNTPAPTIAAVPSPVVAPVTDVAPVAASSGDCVTGYSSGDYYLDKIISYESSGNSCATNSGGCFGLLQACPGEPLRDACGGDPACQIEWFQANKTDGRSWAEVWQHELDYGWW